MADAKPKTPVAIYAVLAFIVALMGFGAWSIYEDAAKMERGCYSAWDEKFHPRYQDGRCSILQRGLRVPEPFSTNNLDPPEARD